MNKTLKKFTIISIIQLMFCGIIVGQDFHYTQYFMSPLGVNPALAGAFSGSYRLNGLYRDQYRGAATKPFTGYGLNIDAPIVRGLREQDWIGVGLRWDQNKSGSNGQRMSLYGLGLSYHLAFSKKQTQYLSIGAQYGAGGFSYDRDFFLGGNEILTGEQSEQLTNLITSGGGAGGGGNQMTVDGGSLNDLTVGLVYSSNNPKTNAGYKFGVAVEGILNPDRGTRGNDQQGLGISGFGSLESPFTKRTSLTSGVYYYSLGGASAINVNGILNYKVKEGQELILHGGLGTRSFRAALIYLGATYKGIRFGLGYDLDIGSSTTATGYHKSVEFGVSYTGIIYKKPDPKPIIYCPRL